MPFFKTRISLALIMLCLGLAVGWLFGSRQKGADEWPTPNESIRQNNANFAFINPLLACNTGESVGAGSNRALEDALNQLIKTEQSKAKVSTVSVYFHSFSDAGWADINPDEKYYPASLGKVPLAVAYLKLAEKDPAVLSKRIFYNDTYDANAQQEIPVPHGIVPGKDYSVQELLQYMLSFSDNNATEFLYNHMDKTVLKEIFSDLDIPFLGPNEKPEDFMTARAFSRFFRILYNATYLNRDASEFVLNMLSSVSFKDGLVRGLPAGTRIVHKFGLVSEAPDGTDVVVRELHDCGIVYALGNPYVLCVMTKGSSSLADLENVIGDVSKVVYDTVVKK